MMFYQIFLSPQVRRWAIISYKDGIYELPHDLPNDLRLKNDRLVPSRPAKTEVLLILAENSWKTEIKLSPLCTTCAHEN